MTEPISNDDQQWLDALAGQEVPNSQLKTHAYLVRQALHRRRQEIEADAAKDRNSELKNLRARLQREGLIHPENAQIKTWLQQVLNWSAQNTQVHGSSSGKSRTHSRVIPVAVLMLLAGGVVWLAIQGRAPQVDERLIYRGDPNVVTLLVDDPEQRAKSLEAGLQVLPGTVTVQALKPSGWLMRIQDSNSVRDYLATQRIEAVAVNGQITLLVLPSEKKTKH